ncbi:MULTISPECIES: hypothetical protein [Haloferacaceae]|uniref:Uncharacterized protein n=1 Tax=Halorubrum glutamatedens TaxID=2707018 RepID=A0ABD5QSG5_9EURY|nr:hypothetical protein [Halobellus captivus]
MTRTVEERFGEFFERVSRADLILLCMPLLFLGGYGAGTLAFDARSVAVAIASIACAPLMFDGLFVNPPSDG